MLRNIRAWWRRRQASRIEIQPELWHEVEACLPFLQPLCDDERRRLHQLVREFLVVKQWTGARGLQLTPSIQLAIAIQACLPILNLGLEWYAGWVGIIVYPGDFIIPRQMTDAAGVVHEFDDSVIGEAWHRGPVLLSWFDDEELDPAANGVNLVIHEFAHQLDMVNGSAEGMPPLHPGMSTRLWRESMSQAFEDFQGRVDAGEGTLIDAYAAEHPAEFFAVCSESFFGRPHELHAMYPAVYAQLKQFYRQDPLSRLTQCADLCLS